ncbi:MAG: hypothetical protein E7254_07540 [Lachnospiraceae bacterium]|nr:hypothetical protein [Lachnospiraceae bacterium]
MEKIKNIKNINVSFLKNECKLDRWYAEMVEKTEEELSVNDLYHMLVQNVFLDIAIPRCWVELKKNPLVGENYDGQFLEKIVNILRENVQYRNIDDYREFIETITKSSLEFDFDEDRKEYMSLLEQLSELFDN